MGDETTPQSSYIQENPEADECCENIPPGVPARAVTAKLKVQVEDVMGCSSTQPLSDICTFSTPAQTSSNGGGKAKSRLSGFQSALTPILKYLNIGNNCQKSAGGSGQHSNSNFYSSHTGRPLGGTDAPVCWLADECLPEITLLDVTCDSTMQLSRIENNSEVPLPGLSKHVGTTAGTDRNAKMVELSESKFASLSWLEDRYLPNLPELTLLDVTQDSEQSPGGQMGVTEDIQPLDNLKTPLSELSGQIVEEPGRSDVTQSEELSSLSAQPDTCVGEKIIKAALEVTQDITMDSALENSRSSSETSGQNTEKMQTSTEDTLGTQPANITRDMNSSNNTSAQCAQFSTSDMECNTSSKKVTSELHDEPVETPRTVEANNEVLLASHDSKLTSNMPQPNPKTAESANSTFTLAQRSSLSASTDLNTTAPISCPQNRTLDLPPSNVNDTQVGSETTDQASSVTTETSSVMNQNCSAVKESGPCDVQNATFDRHSLQKSGGSTISGEAVDTTLQVQNNTFDCNPPKQNGTITLSETSSSDSHQNTLDKPFSPKVCNLTTSLKDNSEVQPPDQSEHIGTAAATDPIDKMVETPDSACEANPVLEVASGADRRDTKDHSQSGLPMMDSLTDTSNLQNVESENNKANTLNLDDTLDLRADALITSTPMTNCKMFNFNTEREEDKTRGVQKKLYGDGPSKPAGQVASDIPSNLICDRKTFLTQPTARSLLPPIKPASQLLKYKPASILPGRFEPPTSGLPMTRQRTQAEALRSAAASDAPQGTTGIANFYNLRATTAGSRLPNSGLRKPQLNGIPSGIRRAAPGLRPPSARSNTPASSSTDKVCGPKATNPVTKPTLAKRQPLTRGEALPASKRKKTDVPPSAAEASTSACDTANRSKNLKQPTTGQRAVPAKNQRDDAAVPASTAETTTSSDSASKAKVLKHPVIGHRALPPKPQSHGCANCVVLEQQLKLKSEEIRRLNEGRDALEEQLKVKSEEIRRLKEELVKYGRQEEEC